MDRGDWFAAIGFLFIFCLISVVDGGYVGWFVGGLLTGRSDGRFAVVGMLVTGTGFAALWLYCFVINPPWR